MNYKVQFVDLETGYTTIQIFPTVESALEAARQQIEFSHAKFRITITTKSIQ